MTSADVLSQLLVEEKSLSSIDVGRSLRFGGIGLFYVVGYIFISLRTRNAPMEPDSLRVLSRHL